MISGNQTPSGTQQLLTWATGDPRLGALGDTALSAAFTFGAGMVFEPERLGVSGVTVTKVGSTFVKQVNPNASGLAQWWERMNIEQTVRDFQKLDNMAPSYTYENGVLTTADAGQYTPGSFWSTWWNGTVRLGTPFNDIRPRNIGANGIIFDPSKNVIQQALEGTALTGLVYGGYQAYQYGNYVFDSPTLSKH